MTGQGGVRVISGDGVSRRGRVAFAVGAVMVAVILAGCSKESPDSSSTADGSSSSSAAATGALPHPRPQCTEEAIQSAAEKAASHFGETVQDIQQFQCSGNFAYAFADVNQQGNVNSVTLLFKANGTSWVPADRGTYCTGGGVPANIYFDACETQ